MRTPGLAMRSRTLSVTLSVAGLLASPVCAGGDTLLENGLLEMRYADGVSRPVQVAWVRPTQPSECGTLAHRLRTEEGEEFCGSFIPGRMEFRLPEQAGGRSQQIGRNGIEGFSLPAERTALLAYQLLSTPDGPDAAYRLVANQRPGLQWVGSRNGSIAQGHLVSYQLDTEVHGSNTSLVLKELRLGQMVMDSGPLAAALGQGLEWRKAGSMSQDNVQVFKGRLLSDADLTVLVNNEARANLSAQAGEVSVFNIPLFEGNNEVTVIYRNERGELVQTSRNIFFSQALLPEGKWTGSAGIYHDQRLRHWAAQAQLEQGLTERLTVQAGARVNMNPESAIKVMNGSGIQMRLRPAEFALSARSHVGGGFLSAGLQTETAYGPGIQRLGYARGTHLFYAEKSFGPARLGAAFEPFYTLQNTVLALPSMFQGVRLGFARSVDGPEQEFTVSKVMRLDSMQGGFLSLYCRLGVDASGADNSFCGMNANIAIGQSPFSSKSGPQPLLAGISLSRADNAGQGAGNSQATINGFMQTRDSYALVSRGLRFVRSRHDFQNFSLQGQYDSQGNLLAGASGLVGLDYGRSPRVIGFLPNNPDLPGEVLVAMDSITPATDRSYSAVQTRINGVLSTGGLNAGAIVGQTNNILVNPESVSMDSELPALRLKISPALPGIYKVGASK
ncbi:MAG TPA: hypothetical protein VFV28_06050 [Limnobacter sp.]|nr:hypothetical protein [Limnobacter sp.]